MMSTAERPGDQPTGGERRPGVVEVHSRAAGYYPEWGRRVLRQQAEERRAAAPQLITLQDVQRHLPVVNGSLVFDYTPEEAEEMVDSSHEFSSGEMHSSPSTPRASSPKPFRGIRNGLSHFLPSGRRSGGSHGSKENNKDSNVAVAPSIDIPPMPNVPTPNFLPRRAQSFDATDVHHQTTSGVSFPRRSVPLQRPAQLEDRSTSLGVQPALRPARLENRSTSLGVHPQASARSEVGSDPRSSVAAGGQARPSSSSRGEDIRQILEFYPEADRAEVEQMLDNGSSVPAVLSELCASHRNFNFDPESNSNDGDNSPLSELENISENSTTEEEQHAGEDDAPPDTREKDIQQITEFYPQANRSEIEQMLDEGVSVSAILSELCASHRNINFDHSELEEEENADANVALIPSEREPGSAATSLDSSVDNPFSEIDGDAETENHQNGQESAEDETPREGDIEQILEFYPQADREEVEQMLSRGMSVSNILSELCASHRNFNYNFTPEDEELNGNAGAALGSIDESRTETIRKIQQAFPTVDVATANEMLDVQSVEGVLSVLAAQQAEFSSMARR